MKVQDLNGGHLGQRITITTANTTATGVLQGFQHESNLINDGTPWQDNWVRGKTSTTITLLPGQDIVAGMKDEVRLNDPTSRFSNGGIIKAGTITAQHLLEDYKHYIGARVAFETGRGILTGTFHDITSTLGDPYFHPDRNAVQGYGPTMYEITLNGKDTHTLIGETVLILEEQTPKTNRNTAHQEEMNGETP